jgi:hypothetical protein
MFILFTVVFLLILALALTVFRWFRPAFGYSWLIAAGGALLVWGSVLLWQFRGTELEFVIMVIAVSCVKLLSAHNSTQHTSRKHKV